MSAAVTRFVETVIGCAETQPVRHHLWPRKYIKYQIAQNGTSYKAKLKAAIDWLIPTSSSPEDLLARL